MTSMHLMPLDCSLHQTACSLWCTRPSQCQSVQQTAQASSCMGLRSAHDINAPDAPRL